MSYASHSITADQPVPQPQFSPILLAADFMALVVMMSTYLSGEDTTLTTIMKSLGVALAVLYIPCHFLFRVRVAPECYLIGLFVIWCWATGYFVATSEQAFFAYGTRLARYCGLAAIVACFATAKRSASSNMIIEIILALYLTIYARLTGFYATGLEQLGTLQSADLAVNYNFIGVLTLWGLVGVVYLWQSFRNPAARLWLAGVGFLMLLTLLASGSRKSFVCFVFFILLWLAFCYGRRAFRSIAAVITVVIILAGVYFVTFYVLPGIRMGERFERATEDMEFQQTRISLYKEAWQFFLAHPVAGVGLGNFEVLSETRHVTHSDLMETLSTTGIVGCVLYFSIYLILVIRILRIRKATADPRIKDQMGVYLAMLLMMLAIGLGIVNFHSIYYWFLLATVIGHTWALSATEAAADPKAARYPVRITC